MKRRDLIVSALSGAAALTAGKAFGQTYPSRPIRWVMPFPAGGPTDVIARKLAEIAGPRIGQPIVVDNKPGANGSIGTGEVVRAAPDGYTFAVAIPDSLVSVASLVQTVSYDARTDLTPIMKICHAQPVLIANAKLGLKNIADLLAAARKAPGTIACGTWGPGTFPHLTMKSIEKATGTRFLDVPYRGLAPAMQDTLANAVQLTIVPPSLALQLQDKGSVTALAVCGTERSPFLPQVATMKEQGIDTSTTNSTLWIALVAPKGLPAPLAKRWTEVLSESVRTPEFENYLKGAGQSLLGTTGADFQRELAAEYVETNELIRSLGIKPL
ncbi:MAG: tripartite tricarboxylate transporter substrate binding protein [Burkholderiales bacterium]|nr:tripartite tricarboxylate transporter substrate binding protein [Burkholderiales bacterium]